MHLNKQNTSASDSTVGSDMGSADAPLREITPAMIKAGVSALLDFDVRNDDPEWVVTAVWEAMCHPHRAASASVPFEPRILRPSRQ